MHPPLRSYKELMVQCNLLGRAESRAQQKVEKAKEQIKKLKARLQELEKEFEEKENSILRDLKASKKLKPEGMNSNFIKRNMYSAHTDLRLSENGTSKNIGPIADSNKPSLIGGKTDHLKRCATENEVQDDLISSNDNAINDETDLETGFSVDEDDCGLPRKSSEPASSASDCKKLVNLCKGIEIGKPSMLVQYEFSMSLACTLASRRKGVFYCKILSRRGRPIRVQLCYAATLRSRVSDGITDEEFFHL